MKIQRIGAPLGVLVEQVDVRTLTDAHWQDVQALFQQHQLLVFRGQQLTPEEHIAFGQRWGELVRHPYAGMNAHPDIIELRNSGKARDINQHWHSDMTYNATPPKLTMLYAHSTPSIGGDTAFANQQLAYEALSTGLRTVVDGLRAVHSAAGLAAHNGADSAKAPRAEHPVVRTHDETGRRALYVCRAFTQRLVDWTREESAALLEYLFAHSVRPEFQARHVWQPGDLALWDNRSLLHFAVHDHADEPRVIHRIQVAGPPPA